MKSLIKKQPFQKKQNVLKTSADIEINYLRKWKLSYPL